MRTVITKHRLHHSSSSFSRLYLPKDCGTRGSKILEAHAIEIGSFHNYMPDDEYRLCQQTSVTIQYLPSVCSYLAERDYRRRLYHVPAVLHQAICKLQNENKSVVELALISE